jgi:hypothetical protein
MSKPTEREIRNALVECGAGGFTLDAEEEHGYTYSTRGHGDICEETPGREDIEAARKAVRHLRSKFPDCHVDMEAVDEWVIIDITTNT